MKFEVGEVYQHCLGQTLDILIIKLQYKTDSYIKLTVQYFYRNGKPLGVIERVIIKKEDFKFWKRKSDASYIEEREAKNNN